MDIPECAISDTVREICTAYEQGYGHGYNRRALKNPYIEHTQVWVAWEYGHGEGEAKCKQHVKNNEEADAF